LPPLRYDSAGKIAGCLTEEDFHMRQCNYRGYALLSVVAALLSDCGLPWQSQQRALPDNQQFLRP
jgi:hypothetical protein